MATTIRLDGVALPEIGIPPISAFSPPALPRIAGLSGLYMLGGSISDSCRNRSVPSLPLVAQGEPRMVNTGARISRSGFDTGILGQGDMTAFIVARVIAPANNAEGQILLGNYDNAAAYAGESFVFNFFSSHPCFSIYITTAAGVSVVRASRQLDTDIVAGDLALFVARIRSTGQCKVWAHQGTFSWASAESAAEVRSIPGRTMTIGNLRATGSSFGGNADVNMVGVYEAALSDVEVDAACAAIKSHYAAIGMPL